MNLNATILGQAITFVLFVWFCMKYIWPPIMAAINKRQQEIADDLALAEHAKKDLYLAQTNAANNLKIAKAEAKALIEQANKRKAQIMDETKADAEKQRNKIIAQAQVEIKAECQRAREELRKQLAMLVILGAEKIIERSVDEATNSDIFDKLVADL